MQLELLNEQGKASSKVDAPDTVFGRDYNEALVHQVVVAYQANARSGNRAQKDREQGAVSLDRIRPCAKECAEQAHWQDAPHHHHGDEKRGARLLIDEDADCQSLNPANREGG